MKLWFNDWQKLCEDKSWQDLEEAMQEMEEDWEDVYCEDEADREASE